MASQGPNSPGTMAVVTTFGSVDWLNPDNAKISDTNYTTATGDRSKITYYLKATNFGFSIPAGATINGILVETQLIASGANEIDVQESMFKLVKSDGTLGTSDLAYGYIPSTTEAYYSRGGVTELWGDAWADTDINDADFGIISQYVLDPSNERSGNSVISVNHIRITVYYTEGASGYSHKVSGVAPAAISKVIGVATASIQSVANIDT